MELGNTIIIVISSYIQTNDTYKQSFLVFKESVFILFKFSGEEKKTISASE